jgi:hypothetical protein
VDLPESVLASSAAAPRVAHQGTDVRRRSANRRMSGKVQCNLGSRLSAAQHAVILR